MSNDSQPMMNIVLYYFSHPLLDFLDDFESFMGRCLYHALHEFTWTLSNDARFQYHVGRETTLYQDKEVPCIVLLVSCEESNEGTQILKRIHQMTQSLVHCNQMSAFMECQSEKAFLRYCQLDQSDQLQNGLPMSHLHSFNIDFNTEWKTLRQVRKLVLGKAIPVHYSKEIVWSMKESLNRFEKALESCTYLFGLLVHDHEFDTFQLVQPWKAKDLAIFQQWNENYFENSHRTVYFIHLSNLTKETEQYLCEALNRKQEA